MSTNLKRPLMDGALSKDFVQLHRRAFIEFHKLIQALTDANKTTSCLALEKLRVGLGTKLNELVHVTTSSVLLNFACQNKDF